jgi:outer membrane protein W
MIRRLAAVVAVLVLTPAALYAQTPVFTITAASADVHKGPITVTPVIGHVRRDTALPISRNLGSWVRVAWPAAPDGVAYVHVTTGRLSGPGTAPSPTPPRSTAASASGSASISAPSATITPPGSPTAAERVGVQGSQGVTTISHVIGVGGLVQSASSFGATGRAWRRDRVGVELRVTRNSMTSDTAAGRVTFMEFEPRVVYALFDHVSDYVWFRPYVGSGVNFSHQTFKDSSPAALETGSAKKMGVRVFGGSELTFAGATRFGLSAELGYRSASTAFAGYETDRVSVSIAGHWYIK